MKLTLALLFLLGGYAYGEEKTCAVKGMHCESCVSTVQEKVCDKAKYSTCEVETGKIHLITADAKAKVDEKAINEALKETTYKATCKMAATKKGAKSS